MVRKIKITRHGLTRCPSCDAHIRVAENLSDTVCPFCKSALKDAVAVRSPLARVAEAGRAGVVAASIMGLTGMSACISGTAPVYGAPADMMVPDTAQDAMPMPEYGMPADIKAPDTAEDAGPQPAYGISADTMEADTAPDAGPQPEYGVPGDA